MNDRAHDRPASAAASRTRSTAGLAARLGKLRPRVPARWREQAEAFWTARNPREQTLLAVGGALLALTIGYSVLWEPAAEGRERLQKSLPQLRAELAEMETLAQEARGLSASPAPALRGEALVQALRDGLSQHGLTASRVAPTGDNTVQVQLDKVPFGAVAAWLSDVRQQQRLKVTDARIVYVGATAIVNVTATLQGPGAGPERPGGRG